MTTEGVHHVLETKPSEELLFPCSSSQQRCWFIHALSPGSSVLNIALRWELKGRFNAATIEQAFQTIVDRHEILRTRFIDKDGEFVQEVAGRLDFHLSVVDLTVFPEEKRLDEAMALGRREAHVPFDIGQLPLIRVTLLRMSADHGILLVTAHQIVFDGLSIRNLAHEFGTIAAALDAKRPHDLPEPPLQYGDYCLWQKEYFASAGFEAETIYWKNKLSVAPYFEIFPDHDTWRWLSSRMLGAPGALPLKRPSGPLALKRTTQSRRCIVIFDPRPALDNTSPMSSGASGAQ
jgi:Condensation domain